MYNQKALLAHSQTISASLVEKQQSRTELIEESSFHWEDKFKVTPKGRILLLGHLDDYFYRTVYVI